MRLLNVHSLEFAEFRSAQIPKYVIASHRWCTGAETSFKDVQKRRNAHQLGYQKVVDFAHYVGTRVRAVDWLWIDTCCIDSRSSQEVSEAINSMFRWYANAEVCIAWLADVDATDGNAFTQSDWFTRGWTLQELLAPATVVFLTREWRVIGHKGRDGGPEACSLLDIGRSLVPAIATLTRIRKNVLRDYHASRGLSVDEKLQWAVGRETTREEDLSYCLFGIFDVAIGANYGEGGDRARRRLLREISADREVGNDFGEQELIQRSQSAALISATLSSDAIQKLKESLRFPRMEDRRAHIEVAYQDTYRWALLSGASDNTWNNLKKWLGERQPPSSIYWINAKPGAGKSSLVRFLEEELHADPHMQPWAERVRLVQVHYYFWSPGSPLQKSLAGLLRTVLFQLFESLPELLPRCVPLHILNSAQGAIMSGIYWTDLELRDCLKDLLSLSSPLVKILFLIDGLDEIGDGNDAQDGLVEFLQRLACYPNVKLCVSSRRWPIFQDAFAGCPQLRLEDLNARDIEAYVRSQFRSPTHLVGNPDLENLIKSVIGKADGVFLWARLVVKDLLRGIRDGDSHHTLEQKLYDIPSDMSRYFDQILESIEPSYRREACAMLQIALHQETEFTPIHPLLLLDLIFTGDAGHDFSLSESHGLRLPLFDSTETLVYQLNSALRRLSSRCKGLLECYLNPGTSFLYGGSYEADLTNMFTVTITAIPPNMIGRLERRRDSAFDLEVDFMHRSLRDHLLEPNAQRFLHKYTGGPIDARNYMRNARLAEILMATHAGLTPSLVVGLSSYFISTLSLPDFRDDRRCALFAMAFQPTVPYLDDQEAAAGPSWYINKSLHSWFEERSDFLTLAIDFGLTGYVLSNLAPEAVRTKRGRPLLDYVLRPRFALETERRSRQGGGLRISVGNQYPNPELVVCLLHHGADPNQDYAGVSVWELFLSFVADHGNLIADSRTASTAYAQSLETMIRSGACTSATISGLSATAEGGLYNSFRRSTNPTSADMFKERWPMLARERQFTTEAGTRVLLLDVLESMRPIFKERIDVVKVLVLCMSKGRQGDPR